MLSPIEATALHRGQTLKRYVRAAAAMNDLYDDASLGHAVGVSRASIGGWWRGAKPSGSTIYRLADVTGLSPEELTRFVYSDGPPPTLPAPGSPAAQGAQEGVERGRRSQDREGGDTPVPSPERPTPDTTRARG